jgi:hypothetical protein
VYRYWKDGKYGDVSCWFSGGILVLTDEPGFSLEFPDPSILMQGDYQLSHKGVENDVMHCRYTNAQITVPPTMGDTELPIFTVGDRYGNTYYSGTPTVYRHQLTSGSTEYVEENVFASVSIPFDPEYGNVMTVKFLAITEWNRRYWAWLTHICSAATLVDNYNHVYWTNPVIRHGFSWLGNVPEGFDMRPDDFYVKQIQERFLTPLHNFSALISRAIEGDNFYLQDEESVSNQALEQLTASKSSGINMLENAGDLVSFFKSVKKGKISNACKSIRKRSRELKRLASKPKLTQTAKLFESSPVLDPNGKLAKDHIVLLNSLRSSLVNNGLSLDEADVVISSGCLNGRTDKVAKKGLELLRGKDLTSRQVISGVGNSWLFYRYCILTTKMDLDELTSGSYDQLIHETKKLSEREWQHVHATGPCAIYQANGTLHLTGKHSFSTWAQPDITNSVQQAFVDNQAIGLLTVSNLWDIVPFSFVVDWFFHVGDFLSKLDAKMGIDAARYQFDVSIDSYTFESDSEVGHMKFYKRSVSPGCRSYSLDVSNSHSTKTGTWVKRFGDSVAMLVH